MNSEEGFYSSYFFLDKAIKSKEYHDDLAMLVSMMSPFIWVDNLPGDSTKLEEWNEQCLKNGFKLAKDYNLESYYNFLIKYLDFISVDYNYSLRSLIQDMKENIFDNLLIFKNCFEEAKNFLSTRR